MRRCLNTFFQHVVCQLRHIPVTAGVRVALAIVDRVTEGSLSVELLCQKNRARDAAVLLLCLHELRLDLQYIALDRSRANCWLEHSKTDKKPWRVSSQLEEIYTNENELKAERWLYRQYSMVKHCNPVGENFVFGIAAKRDSLTLGSRSHDSVNAPHAPVWTGAPHKLLGSGGSTNLGRRKHRGQRLHGQTQ